MTVSLYFSYLVVFIFALIILSMGREDVGQKMARDKLKKKDVRDYTDADVETLYEQWEEQDEPLEDDELPEWKKPSPKIDLTKIDLKNPESILKMTKKGKTLMMFATVTKQSDAERVSSLWQTSLFNANIEVQRHIIAPKRILFVISDGSLAWDVKDFLVQQESCVEVSLEGKDYKGKGASQKKSSEGSEKTEL